MTDLLAFMIFLFSELQGPLQAATEAKIVQSVLSQVDHVILR